MPKRFPRVFLNQQRPRHTVFLLRINHPIRAPPMNRVDDGPVSSAAWRLPETALPIPRRVATAEEKCCFAIHSICSTRSKSAPSASDFITWSLRAATGPLDVAFGKAPEPRGPVIAFFPLRVPRRAGSLTGSKRNRPCNRPPPLPSSQSAPLRQCVLLWRKRESDILDQPKGH